MTFTFKVNSGGKKQTVDFSSSLTVFWKRRYSFLSSYQISQAGFLYEDLKFICSFIHSFAHSLLMHASYGLDTGLVPGDKVLNMTSKVLEAGEPSEGDGFVRK